MRDVGDKVGMQRLRTVQFLYHLIKIGTQIIHLVLQIRNRRIKPYCIITLCHLLHGSGKLGDRVQDMVQGKHADQRAEYNADQRQKDDKVQAGQREGDITPQIQPGDQMDRQTYRAAGEYHDPEKCQYNPEPDGIKMFFHFSIIPL